VWVGDGMEVGVMVGVAVGSGELVVVYVGSRAGTEPQAASVKASRIRVQNNINLDNIWVILPDNKGIRNSAPTAPNPDQKDFNNPKMGMETKESILPSRFKRIWTHSL
jgi:hypothetical protein